jgi:hypothetical protein
MSGIFDSLFSSSLIVSVQPIPAFGQALDVVFRDDRNVLTNTNFRFFVDHEDLAIRVEGDASFAIYHITLVSFSFFARRGLFRLIVSTGNGVPLSFGEHIHFGFDHQNVIKSVLLFLLVFLSSGLSFF